MSKKTLDLKQKSQEELKKMATDKEKEILKARLELARGLKKNVRVVKTMRQDLARIKTFLNMKGETQNA